MISCCFINFTCCSLAFRFLVFGAPLVPFTQVSFVDTHLFVSSYALLSSRTSFGHALDSGCLRYLLCSTLLIGNVCYVLLVLVVAINIYDFRCLLCSTLFIGNVCYVYQCWLSQYTFTIFLESAGFILVVALTLLK